MSGHEKTPKTAIPMATTARDYLHMGVSVEWLLSTKKKEASAQIFGSITRAWSLDGRREIITCVS